MASPRFLIVAVMGALGAGAALGMPPQGAVLATLICLAVLFYLFPNARSPKEGALWGWAFATGYFAVALRWIVEPFQIEADIFGWMAPFALALLAAGLALFWGLAGWVSVRMWSTPVRRSLGLVVMLSLVEFARAYVLTGFPWAGLAQVWIDTPFAQSLSRVGPHGLALLTLLMPCGLAILAHQRRAGSLALGVSLLAFVLLPWRLAPIPTYDTETRPTIRIVQPNAPQDEKWDPEKWQIFFWRQVESTRAGPERPDLIVWPETAIPQLLNHAEETLKIVAEAAQGVPVVIGMQRADARNYYNSMIVLDQNGEVGPIYDKHHLVPFGEYMPFPALFRSLGIQALAERADGGYAAGSGPEILDFAGVGRALALICYEAVFPQHSTSDAARPDFLLQITNDAWFGTYAGPQQHLAQARMRAIEQGLPVVRSANTGISAMIDARGHIVDQLALGEHGHIDVALPVPGEATFYSKTGDWLSFGLILLGLGVLFPRRRRL